jgi:hypothetical protein
MLLSAESNNKMVSGFLISFLWRFNFLDKLINENWETIFSGHILPKFDDQYSTQIFNKNSNALSSLNSHKYKNSLINISPFSYQLPNKHSLAHEVRPLIKNYQYNKLINSLEINQFKLVLLPKFIYSSLQFE